MNKIYCIAAFLMFAISVDAGNLRNPFDNVSLLDSSRIHDLDEVVIISQPKEVFKLRKQPLSSTVFSSKEISLLGTHDLRELSVYVPNFVMPNYGSRYTSAMYVRGIGSRVNSPAVGIYVDGMPIVNKAGFNTHTYQLSRVDILRGPQGTLYGQNTEGGLIRIYTVNPMNYQGTDIKLGVGTKFYRNAEFAHYNKLSDKFAFSLAGFYDGQDGFFRNIGTGKRADRYNEAGGRIRLVYQPTSRLSFDYIADYQYIDQNGFPYGVIQEDGTTASPNTNRQSCYLRNLLTNSLNIGYRADAFTFSSVTSYQYLKDRMLMDQDYLPSDFMHLEQTQLQQAITEELTFKSNAPIGGFWHWTVGGFFSQEWLKTGSVVYFDDDMNAFLSNRITNYAYTGMLNAMAANMHLSTEAVAAMIERMGGCNINMAMSNVPGTFHTPTTNFGLYHESNFDISKRLTATLGLRYDFSHVAIDYLTNATATLVEDVIGQHIDASIESIINNKTRNDFNQLLPKFGIVYRIDNNNSNIYATVSKGYRAGGFNIQMFSDVLQTELSAAAQSARGNVVISHNDTYYNNINNTISYKPETSWNYEIGTHLNLFNNSVHFDLSAFYMQVRNQQLSVMAGNYGFGRMMVNAGKSNSCGIEVALRGEAFNNHLAWGLNYGYTRAVFDEYNDSVTVNGITTHISYKDKKVPYVPMHTIAAHADYTFNISNTGLRFITIGANMNAQGKTYWDVDNDYYQKLYAVLGAHADMNFGFVNISFWGRNLTDAKYNTFAVQSSATGTKYTFAQQGNPFQCGVDFNFHF